VYEGEEHEVKLLDDGTLDTVIKIDGDEFRFGHEHLANRRRPDGSLPKHVLIALAKEAIDGALV
jgi:hypothetical protein